MTLENVIKLQLITITILITPTLIAMFFEVTDHNTNIFCPENDVGFLHLLHYRSHLP